MPADDAPLAQALQKAYRLQALRAHSEKELGAKLHAGGFTEPVIAAVLARCREMGYLDDGRYARQRARLLAVERLAGNRRILLDLRARGIPEELSREAIAEARREIGEEEAVERLIERKTRGIALARIDERDRGRLARSLMGKGFSTGLILRKLNARGEEGLHDDDGE
jgi:regulatory protein